MHENDPIAQLEAEHQAMRQLFADWRDLSSCETAAPSRQSLAERICLELAIHTRLEEEMLYPLARQALGNDPLLDAAEDEHAGARDRMGRVLIRRPADAQYDSAVASLCEYVEQHMSHESEVLFPRLRRCGVDLALLGHRLRERRRELEAVPEALREEALVSTFAA